jgi:DNA-directed RNA polymerase specialized sigma24 family protein
VTSKTFLFLSPVACHLSLNFGDVKELAPPKSKLKKDWMLTPQAFCRLLEWLGEDEETGGRRYLEMRARLVDYFDRKNCATPDELADEVLNRAARRLEEEGAIETDTPAHFLYILARYVFLESLRDEQREDVPLDESLRVDKRALASEEQAEETMRREKMLDCLERCAAKLDEESRALIFAYYCGEQRAKIENRRALAARFRLTPNALAIRACRIRERLEQCVRRCAGDA